MEPTRLFGSTSYVFPFFRSIHFPFSRWPTNQIEVEVSDSIFETEAQPDIEIEAVEATEATEAVEAVDAIEAVDRDSKAWKITSEDIKVIHVV